MIQSHFNRVNSYNSNKPGFQLYVKFVLIELFSIATNLINGYVFVLILNCRIVEFFVVLIEFVHQIELLSGIG